MKFRKPLSKLRCCQAGTGRAGSLDTGLVTHLVTVLSLPVLTTLYQVAFPTFFFNMRTWPLLGRELLHSGLITLKDKPTLLPVVRKYTLETSPEQAVQFLLDCTVLPEVISLTQVHGQFVHDSLLYLTRTYCFSLHKMRLKFLGKWNKK